MELQDTLGASMKEIVEHVNTFPEEYDKLSILQDNTAALKHQLCKNVDAVLQRSESLQLVTLKADNMSSHSKKFTKMAADRKQELWWRNMKMKAVFYILAAVVVVVVLLVLLELLDVLPWSIRGDTKNTPHKEPTNEEEAEDLYFKWLAEHNLTSRAPNGGTGEVTGGNGKH